MPESQVKYYSVTFTQILKENMTQESIRDDYIIFKAVHKFDQVGYTNEKGQENVI